ncbi:MAG: hypothetical protein ABIP54_02295 [Candidatus Andersenbacteria bacterium]
MDPSEFKNAKLPNGDYHFTVMNIFEKDKDGFPLVDGSNAPKIRLQLKLKSLTSGGNVFEELVASEKMAWKTKSFADSVGMPSMYSSSKFDTDSLKGLTGQCKLKENKWTGTDGKVRENQQVEFLPALVEGEEVKEDLMDQEIPF